MGSYKMSDEFQLRLYAGNVPNNDTECEETVSNANQSQINRWLEIFFQLNKSVRFKDFVNSNYVIVDDINEEDKEITTLVVENPISTGPSLSSEQIIEIGKVLRFANVKDVANILISILTILGQKNATELILDTDVDKAVRELKLIKN